MLDTVFHVGHPSAAYIIYIYEILRLNFYLFKRSKCSSLILRSRSFSLSFLYFFPFLWLTSKMLGLGDVVTKAHIRNEGFLCLIYFHVFFADCKALLTWNLHFILTYPGFVQCLSFSTFVWPTFCPILHLEINQNNPCKFLFKNIH